MQSNELRAKFLNFFSAKGHRIIPSASLIPENDGTVLFTTAGMQQFKQYYTHPEDADRDFGNRNIATVQKCVRTGDIDEVGDATHLTFLEMLGSFSFGGYGKKEAIEYAHEFITKELNLKIDYVSVFKGDKETSADTESQEIWSKMDPNLNIKSHNREDNFWGPTGEEGPCGPTTEIYINGVEIWNIVFNEFYKTREGKYEPLKIKGVDTGMGLERLLVQVEKKNNVFETDLFKPVIEKIEENTNSNDLKGKKIVADHIRTAAFVITDGVTPSNTGRGYVLRRLLRRARYYYNSLGARDKSLHSLVSPIISTYGNAGYGLVKKSSEIEKTISEEETKFLSTLELGTRQFEKIVRQRKYIGGVDAFMLFSTYGFPLELTIELAEENHVSVDNYGFNQKLAEHQKLSQTASAGMFKGGLTDHNEKTIKLHTAHHLLLAALQAVVDKNIKQRGSNITAERLRLDFLCNHKLSDEEKKKAEDWVNDKIKMELNVVRREMPMTEAQKIGAEMEFGAKYPEIVSVYFIEDKDERAISRELCGGPHVFNTKELGRFKILKEEAVSQGIRRIKAILS